MSIKVKGQQRVAPLLKDFTMRYLGPKLDITPVKLGLSSLVIKALKQSDGTNLEIRHGQCCGVTYEPTNKTHTVEFKTKSPNNIILVFKHDSKGDLRLLNLNTISRKNNK